MATRSSIRAARRQGGLVSAFRCQRFRLNCLWSLWYCAVVLALEVYLTANSIQQFVRYISLPWPEDAQPSAELNAYVGFVGASVVLLPFFVVTAVFKVGNLANDGCKLGSGPGRPVTGTQSSPPLTPMAAIRTLWRHSGPTAPFLHIISAFCLLFPKVLIQGKLIKHGFLHKDDIWRSDLDFMITHKDRIVVLSILASTNHSSGAITPPPEDLSGSLGHRRGVGVHGLGGADDPGRTFDELSPVSPEFVNYALALLVYAVRYSAVFWDTNKPFSFLFSLQLVFGALQSLLAYTGFAVLYKLDTYGLDVVLPTSDGFLLERHTAVLLYLLSNAVIGLSGGVVYFYGLRKFQAGVVREREKHHVSWREGSRTLWGYLPHCLAFAVLVAAAVVTCPLMYDYTVIYKGSLDGAILSCVVGTIMYFFLWIVLWFVLTLKQRWHFRLQAGAAAACNGKISRLAGDIELQKNRPAKNAPLIVVCGGQTFTVKELAPKKAIMSIVHRAAQHHQQRLRGGAEEDDDIYWLKPKPPSPKQSPEAERAPWVGSKRKGGSPGVKHKVTFEDSLGGSPRRVRGNIKSPKTGTKAKKQSVKFEDLTDTEDDGDYATLRDIPLIREDDEEQEEALENLLKDVGPDVVGDSYCRKESPGQLTDDDLRSPSIERDYEDAERMCLLVKSPIHQINVAVTVHDESPSPHTPLDGLVAKSSDDEHADVATTRSNSLSSSCSPPEKGNSSDTSSGIHSSSSICDATSARRSSSMDFLPTDDELRPRVEPCWKSLSLQRAAAASFAPGRGLMTVAPPGGLDYVGTGDRGRLQQQQRDTMMVVLRKQKRPKTADLTANLERFGRETNMRLTSFTEAPVGGDASGPKTVAKGIAKQKIAPITIGILNSSPRHLPYTPDLRRISNPNALGLNQSRQRDSANYSLTSSGDSDR